jgi:hypothetical protein
MRIRNTSFLNFLFIIGQMLHVVESRLQHCPTGIRCVTAIPTAQCSMVCLDARVLGGRGEDGDIGDEGKGNIARRKRRTNAVKQGDVSPSMEIGWKCE